MKNFILLIMLATSISACAQESRQSTNTTDKTIDTIEAFLIKEKQISEKNSVKIIVADIIDGKKLSEKDKGVFIIRTGTHKTEYLLFKNKEGFNVVKFDNLNSILEHAIKLFSDESDEDLLVYSKELLERYEENIPSEPKFVPRKN
ncbi:hypothetical protein [uncultured Psychroserpens sp.]|uniref:hypothetical protein n=1 Tax=uncultured Psychroserpens sp. TaxID=255436 RepID=UPI00261D12E3|nr:hypothetical protein [uncultured Psychroserpens sp.]